MILRSAVSLAIAFVLTHHSSKATGNRPPAASPFSAVSLLPDCLTLSPERALGI